MTQAQIDAIETELDREEAWDELCEWWRDEFGEDLGIGYTPPLGERV